VNLQAITAGAIGAVNPPYPATLKTSTGSTVAGDGTQTPTYNITQVTAQVQAMSGGDLRKTENLNLQGVVRAVYLQGDVEGLVRSQNRGGDILIFNRQTWLVAAVLEHWTDWAKVAVVLQTPSAP
jgi:hypothetical protein